MERSSKIRALVDLSIDPVCEYFQDEKRPYKKRRVVKKEEKKVITKSNQKGFRYIEHNILQSQNAKNAVDQSLLPHCSCFPIPDLDPSEIELIEDIYCGSNCMNRLMHFECNPKTCPCGKMCTNCRFQKVQGKKVMPFSTVEDGKGWGLMALENIPAYHFVIEYVGEVLSVGEAKERLESRKLSENFYILNLQNGQCIDAEFRGNLARFINHSCNPNCITQKWNVLGEMCIGIFALRDIVKGEELTFDYRFEKLGKHEQECKCGSVNCRGSLSSLENEEHLPNENQNQNQNPLIKKIIKKKKNRNEKNLAKPKLELQGKFLSSTRMAFSLNNGNSEDVNELERKPPHKIMSYLKKKPGPKPKSLSKPIEIKKKDIEIKKKGSEEPKARFLSSTRVIFS